uniref:Uncharacterized protein AaDL n=1 Tax=Asparagus asparagoides TaxID=59054 RepID=D2Z0F1_9ASPA|nr:hypothetical protein [Asparagus asparagoides]
MDLVTPQEHLCYVRCAYCSTVLAVGVPCKRMMDAVTVKCGHCNSLSYLNPRPAGLVPSLNSSDYHNTGLQSPFNYYRKGHQLLPSSSTSSEDTSPKAPYVVKPPEKKHRLPSAYNRFMREEIQRIKAANPEMPHREAFSTAAKNWAKYEPRGLICLTAEKDGTPKAIALEHEKTNGLLMKSFDIFKQIEPRI